MEGAILTRERIETTPRAIDTTINKNETRAVIDCNKVKRMSVLLSLTFREVVAAVY